MQTIILGVDSQSCILRFKTGKTVKKFRFSSFKGMISLMKDLKKQYSLDYEQVPIMCSSSMDFPEEYTKNQTIIKLAQKIRSEE